MPHSAGENIEYVQKLFRENFIESAVDVGPGAGLYADILKEDISFIQGVEIWPAYVTQYELMSKYDSILIADIRDIEELAPLLLGDAIIFGDVLEHMTREESISVVNTAKILFDYIFISIPIIHWPQGATDGNPYEVHVQEHISVDDALEMFGPVTEYKVFDQTATFFINNK